MKTQATQSQWTSVASLQRQGKLLAMAGILAFNTACATTEARVSNHANHAEICSQRILQQEYQGSSGTSHGEATAMASKKGQTVNRCLQGEYASDESMAKWRLAKGIYALEANDGVTAKEIVGQIGRANLVVQENGQGVDMASRLRGFLSLTGEGLNKSARAVVSTARTHGYFHNK